MNLRGKGQNINYNVDQIQNKQLETLKVKNSKQTKAQEKLNTKNTLLTKEITLKQKQEVSVSPPETAVKQHVKKGVFQCNLCPKTFSELYNMRAHIKNIHNLKPHECGLCGETFDTMNMQKEHADTVHNGEFIRHSREIRTTVITHIPIGKRGTYRKKGYQQQNEDFEQQHIDRQSTAENSSEIQQENYNQKQQKQVKFDQIEKLLETDEIQQESSDISEEIMNSEEMEIIECEYKNGMESIS